MAVGVVYGVVVDVVDDFVIIALFFSVVVLFASSLMLARLMFSMVLLRLVSFFTRLLPFLLLYDGPDLFSFAYAGWRLEAERVIF
jgi:hypothetical protein